jgi:hypothetical protein
LILYLNQHPELELMGEVFEVGHHLRLRSHRRRDEQEFRAWPKDGSIELKLPVWIKQFCLLYLT